MSHVTSSRWVVNTLMALATIATSVAQAAAPDIDVVEYVHRDTRHFFMTGSKAEQTLLDGLKDSFARTGRSFAAWSQEAKRPAETEQVMRFFVPSISSHVYTSNPSDIALLRSMPASRFANGFVDEGTAFHLERKSADTCATGQRAIYRAYNNRPDGNHRYSNDLPTQAATVNAGFVHEGIAFCAPNASSDDAIEKSAGAPREAGEDVTVSGTVSAFVSVTNFSVGTQKVNAGNARFDRAAATALATGVSVKVEGVVISGVLMATEVKFLNPPSGMVDEFKGFVTALGNGGKLFVNGTEVDTATALITGGMIADILIGTQLEIHGNFRDGVFVATRVEIEDAPGGVQVSGQGLAEVEGTISSYTSAKNFIVNGQAIDAATATFRDGTVNDLAVGVAVEVKGKIANGILVATRVELKSVGATTPGTNPPDAIEFEAKGTVSGFVSASQFIVAGKTIDASSASFLRGTAADLKNGAIVEIKGSIVGTVVKATLVKFDDDIAGTPVVGVEFEAKGTISSFVSAASFVLGGKTIDASSAVFVGGTAADLKSGVIVEVKGTLINGVVKATRVSFEDAPDAIEFEAKGAVSSFVSVSSFVVGGKTIDASSASFERGTVSDLKNGVIVEVKGDLVGGVVKATRIRFEK